MTNDDSTEDPMPPDDRPAAAAPMSREELAAALDRSLAAMPPDPWKPKVLGVTADGAKLVSMLDWLRLRRDSIEGWEGAEEVTLAYQTYRAGKDVADEITAAMADQRSLSRKKGAARSAVARTERAQERWDWAKPIWDRLIEETGGDERKAARELARRMAERWGRAAPRSETIRRRFGVSQSPKRR
jgi:hypothetical protein